MTTARLVAWLGGVLFWVALAVLRMILGVPLADAILLSILLVAVPIMSLAQVLLAGVEDGFVLDVVFVHRGKSDW